MLFAHCSIPTCWGFNWIPINYFHPLILWKSFGICIASTSSFFNIPLCWALARDVWVDFNRFWSWMLFTLTQWPWHHDPGSAQLSVGCSVLQRRDESGFVCLQLLDDHGHPRDFAPAKDWWDITGQASRKWVPWIGSVDAGWFRAFCRCQCLTVASWSKPAAPFHHSAWQTSM